MYRVYLLVEIRSRLSPVTKGLSNDAATLDIQTKATTPTYAGLDLGRQNDYTVLTIMDQNKNVIFVYRENQKEWNHIIENIVKYIRQFNVRRCFVETNNVGDVIEELLRKELSGIISGQWTGTNKISLIESLIVEFENKTIKIPKKEQSELYNELVIFSYEYNPKTRGLKYSAPSGFHDDCVMSLAICLECYKQSRFAAPKVSTIKLNR
jgi:hypothetical protein